MRDMKSSVMTMLESSENGCTLSDMGKASWYKTESACREHARRICGCLERDGYISHVQDPVRGRVWMATGRRFVPVTEVDWR